MHDAAKEAYPIWAVVPCISVTVILPEVIPEDTDIMWLAALLLTFET